MTVPDFHKSCRTISVYSFYKANMYQDFRYLIKEYNEDDANGKFDEFKNDIKLKVTLKNILEEYSVLIRDKKSLRLRKMEWELMYHIGQHSLIIKVLKIYAECKLTEVLEILNDLQIPFDKDKPIGLQLDKAVLYSKHLKNKINIKSANFKKLSGITDEETDPDDVINGLDKTALSLEKSLELGYHIDIKTTVMERWVNLIEMNRKQANSSK